MAYEPKKPLTEQLKKAAAALCISCASELPEPPEARTAKKIWGGTLTRDHQDMAGKLYDGLKALADGGFDYKKNKKRPKNQAALDALGTKDDFLKLAAEQYESTRKELETSHRNFKAVPISPASSFTVERILLAPFCPGVAPSAAKRLQGVRYKREEGDSLVFESSNEAHIELRWFRWGGAVWTARETKEFQSLADLASHRRHTYRDVLKGQHCLRALTERINRTVSAQSSGGKCEQTHIGYALSIYSLVQSGWPEHNVPNALQLLACPNVLLELSETADCEVRNEGNPDDVRSREAQLLRDGAGTGDLREIHQPGHVRGYACWAGVAIHVEEGVRSRLLQSAISFQQELQSLWWRLHSLSTGSASGKPVPVTKELFQTLRTSVQSTLRIGPTEVTSLRLFKEAVIATSRFSSVFDDFQQNYRDNFPTL